MHRIPGRRAARLALATAGLAMLACIAAAQTFRSGVNLVILPVTVTDADGRFLGNFTRDDFSIFEDGRQRPIQQFSAERVPVSLGILIDVSGSMEGVRFADARAALSRLLERCGGDDRMFLAVFNEAFRVLVPWTSDHGALTQALSGVSPRGGTSLFSAMSAALPVLDHGPNQKKALVIISDGDDNSMPGVNREALDRAVGQAKASEAVVYVVGIGRPKPPFDEFIELLRDPTTRRELLYNPPVDVEVLRQLTDPTGGYSQLVALSADLSSTVIHIVDDLSAQYVIGFESAQPSDGKSHTVKVTVARAGAKVRTRTAYVAVP